MASELVAAFRAMLTFLVLSWGAFMYLIFYRIPALDSEYVYVARASEGKTEGDEINGYAEEQKLSYENVGRFGGEHRNLAQHDQEVHLELWKTMQAKAAALRLRESWMSINSTTHSLIQSANIFSLAEEARLCQELRTGKEPLVVGFGYTKIVRKAFWKDKAVAVKSVHLEGHDIKSCMQGKQKGDFLLCANLARYKLLREAVLLSQLKTPHIIKLLGACVWSSSHTGKQIHYDDNIAVITELGKPLSLLEIIRWAWDERFKISWDLLLLLYYLSHSPYGSLIITDFKIDQFVMVNGNVKLSDVDDLDNRPRACRSNDDCLVGGNRWNTTLPCINSICLHYNEKFNLYNLYRLFLDYTLDFENPRGLERKLSNLAEKIRTFQYRVSDVLEELQSIIRSIKLGSFALKWTNAALAGHLKQRYETFQGAYVPKGVFDFYCPRSRSLTSCELSVHNMEEAEVLCTLEKSCTAFVVTPNKNWLGQLIVVLKTHAKILMSNSQYSVRVKV